MFDKAGNFVAKSYVLDGADAQSQDSKKIAQALWSWQQQVERQYSNDLVYQAIDKNDTRFFPKGIYSVTSLQTDDEYAGGKNNLFHLKTLDGKEIAQAIHGFYNEPARVVALEQLKTKIVGLSPAPISIRVCLTTLM